MYGQDAWESVSDTKYFVSCLAAMLCGAPGLSGISSWLIVNCGDGH